MAELDVLHVVGNGIEPLGFRHHLVRGRKDELGIFVDELLNQPRTRNAIDFDLLAGNPFHLSLLLEVFHQVSASTSTPPCLGEITYSLSGMTIAVVWAPAAVIVRRLCPVR